MKDVWETKAIRLKPKEIRILIMTKAEIDKAYQKGEILKEDYDKYWKKTNADHLVEFAIELSNIPSELKPYLEQYMKNGYAIRCGGKNQCKNPLNVFLIKI